MTGGRPLSTRDPATIARDDFGYPSLRPGQREVIEAVVAGRDAMAVMATGAGKSAIYAIAGRMLGRPTIVVSPLLALQRDQAASLVDGAGLRAVTVNSAVSAAERDDALTATAAGRADYVFLAPEQLADPGVLTHLRQARPGLIAVDEAHLVSQWGHDFRPDYLAVADAADRLGRPPILALTATAAPPVREDIVTRLRLRAPLVRVHGFDRPNIHLAVQTPFRRDLDKLEALAHDVPHAARRGQGIVYAGTRKGVEGLVDDWAGRGLRAASYHAGLPKAERALVEHDFFAGNVDVVVATVAFGMGVDKPDVRWVFHADIPGSLDEYYQEVGRAGRDGGPAEAVLYFRPDDLRIPRLFAASTGPSRESLSRAATALDELGPTTTVTRMQRAMNVSRARAAVAMQAMADAGAVVLGAHGRVTVVADLDAAVEAAEDAVDRRRVIERSRAETVEAYAETQGCRRRFLLEYFGEEAVEHCGRCDNCERVAAGDQPAAQDGEDVPFARGTAVRHPKFGIGEVIGYADGRVLIGFDEAGYKRLDLGLVAEGDLLQPAADQ